MKVRIGKELSKKMTWQRDHMGDGAGAVFNRALRKYHRLGKPEPSPMDESTYGGTVITVDAPDGWTADMVRALLWWHLASVPDERPRRITPREVEGVDYVVEDWCE